MRHGASKFAALVALCVTLAPTVAMAECRERLLDRARGDNLTIVEASDAGVSQVVDAATALRRASRADVVFFAGSEGWHAIVPFASHRQVRRLALANPSVEAGWCALESAYAAAESSRGRRAAGLAAAALAAWASFAFGLRALLARQKPKRSDAVQSS